MGEASRSDWIDTADKAWTWGERFGVPALIGALLGGGASRLTSALQHYAPFSWGLGALLGAVGFQALSLLAAARRERQETTRRIAALQAPKGQVNPLQKRFEYQRIYVSDLMPVRGTIVEGKAFEGCEIVGPANIHFATRGVLPMVVSAAEFVDCGGMIVREGVPLINVSVFMDCSFNNCSFFGITVIAGKHDAFVKALPNFNWLT